MTSFLASLFGKAPPPTKLPLDDIQKALASFCTVPVQDAETHRQARVTSSQMKQIQTLLKHYESHSNRTGWSQRPRIYTVLYWIDRLDVLPTFIDMDYLDIHLPFTLSNLPVALGASRHEFLKYQEKVLTDAKELEKGIDGKHVHFNGNADDLFISWKELGSGGSGYVDQVWSRLSYEEFARKRFHRGHSSRESREGYDKFIREISALKRLSHQHLVKVFGSYSDEKCFAFLMAPVADRNLSVYLDRLSSQELPTLRSFFGCLTNAIAYLHSQKLNHMDIKPENILIKDGKVYVADFGAAQDRLQKERTTTWSAGPRTDRYSPPEVSRDAHAPRNSFTDMWSLGVVFLEMTTVLRGRQAREFNHYLTEYGTKHKYVYGNPSATYSWFEVLRKSEAGPDSDNEPLAWIKDLLQHDPLNRPNSQALVKQILEFSSSKQFCGFCCSNPSESVWPTSQKTSLYTVQDSVIVTEAHTDVLNYNQNASNVTKPTEQFTPQVRHSAIEAWLGRSEDALLYPADGGLEPSVPEMSDLPYDIDEDEDDDTAGSTVSFTLLPNHLPQRLSCFNFSADETGYETVSTGSDNKGDCEADEAVYDVLSDRSGSSEETIRPCDPSLEPLFAELENIEEDHPEPPIGLPSELKYMNTRPMNTITAPATINSDDTVLEDTPFLTAGSESQSRCETQASNPVSLSLNIPLSPHSVEKRFVHLGTHPDILNSPESTQVTAEVTPTPLTLENLGKLDPSAKANIETKSWVRQSRNRSLRSAPRISAKDYMANLWEAESSAATSVISKTTKAKLAGLGSLTAYQDRTQNLLGFYCKLGKAAAVRLLLEKNCNPGTKEKPRPGPLFSAVRGASARHTKCVRLLLDFGADVNAVQSGMSKKRPLHCAIEHRYFEGYERLISLLLHRGADPNVKDASGDYPILQILYGSYEPLEKHKRDALALLLATHITIDVNIMPPGTQNKPLHLAVRRKDPWAVSMLLAAGATVNEPNGAGITPLAMAASSWTKDKDDYQVELCKHLLLHGVDVNQRIGDTGSTALQIAVLHGRADLVQPLMDSKADPYAVNNAGDNAFDLASRSILEKKVTVNIHRTIMEELFEAANFDIPLARNTCPVVTAVQNSDIKLCNLLFKHGASPDQIAGAEKRPLLYIAVAQGGEAMVQLLLKRGALVNHSRYDAVEHAKTAGQTRIEVYLRNHIAARHANVTS